MSEDHHAEEIAPLMALLCPSISFMPENHYEWGLCANLPFVRGFTVIHKPILSSPRAGGADEEGHQFFRVLRQFAAVRSVLRVLSRTPTSLVSGWINRFATFSEIRNMNFRVDFGLHPLSAELKHRRHRSSSHKCDLVTLKSKIVISRCSSGVEQLIRNEQVVGSNPTSGS